MTTYVGYAYNKRNNKAAKITTFIISAFISAFIDKYSRATFAMFYTLVSFAVVVCYLK